jgi:hypothetical protein
LSSHEYGRPLVLHGKRRHQPHFSVRRFPISRRRPQTNGIAFAAIFYSSRIWMKLDYAAYGISHMGRRTALRTFSNPLHPSRYFETKRLLLVDPSFAEHPHRKCFSDCWPFRASHSMLIPSFPALIGRHFTDLHHVH